MSGGCLCKNISHLLEDNKKLTRLNESVVCWMASLPAEWEKDGDVFNLPALKLQKMIEDMRSWLKEFPAELRDQMEKEGEEDPGEEDPSEEDPGAEDPGELEMNQEQESDCIELEDTDDEMEQKEDKEEDRRNGLPDKQKRNENPGKVENIDETPVLNSMGKIRIDRISYYSPKKKMKNQPSPNPILVENGYQLQSSVIKQNGRYPCDVCEKTFAKNYHRKHHIKTQHLGVRYLCNQCEFSSSSNSNLTAHKNNKHSGLRFPCDQCEVTLNDKRSLKQHMMLLH